MRKLPSHPNPKVIRTLHRWHRRIGLIAAFFVVLLSITGIPLHHADNWGLTHANVSSDWLLDSYGIAAPDQYKSFAINNIRITQLDDRIYFNDRLILEQTRPLVGATLVSDILIAATQDQIILLTTDGELIDDQPVPVNQTGRLTALTNMEQNLLLKGKQGIFVSNAQFDTFKPIQFVMQPNWSMPTPLPEKQFEQLAHSFRAQSLSWERVLLDLHSGRLFGPLGPWVMDIAAVLFLLMAVSGIWLWSRKKRW